MIFLLNNKILLNNQEVGNIDYLPDSSWFDLEEYFLKSQELEEEVFNKIKSKIPDKVLILKYMDIDPEYQNQGLGSQVLSLLKQHSSIVLICEMREEHVYAWYQSHGFVTISYLGNLPIMVFIK